MLRVHDFGFAWIDAEKLRIEKRRFVQNAASPHQLLAACDGVRCSHGKLRFRFRETGDRVHALNQILPKFLHIARAGKASRHADNGDGLGDRIVRLTHARRGLRAARAWRCFKARCRMDPPAVAVSRPDKWPASERMVA